MINNNQCNRSISWCVISTHPYTLGSVIDRLLQISCDMQAFSGDAVDGTKNDQSTVISYYTVSRVSYIPA